MIARFVAEAWVNDNAVEIDPEGPTEWDCTAAFAALPDDYRADLLAEADAAYDDEALDRYDRLKVDPAAPPWVRAHRGPFSIYVRREATA